MKKRLGIVLILLIVCVAPVLAQTGRQVLFPRFASGGGWTTEFGFSNQGLMSEDITVDFYDQQGILVSVVTNLGTNSSFTFTLNAGGSQIVRMDSSGLIKEGYVVANYPMYSSPIRGTCNYRYEQAGLVLVEVGIPQQEWGQHFSFPVVVKSSQLLYTAIAFSKPVIFSDSAESILVSLINADGSIHTTKKLQMNAGQHLAGYIDQDWLFPGLDNFEGTLSVSSPSGIGVMTLRQDKQAFGATSIDSGPMVGAFALTGSVIDEIEPNDHFVSAQEIATSTIIQGNIDYPGDADGFRFTGIAGDIVTVICDTSYTYSYLDPLLNLFDNQFEVLFISDNSGINYGSYYSYDSFIQFEIPVTGSYYIGVVDSAVDFYGGDNYSYRLHVILPR